MVTMMLLLPFWTLLRQELRFRSEGFMERIAKMRPLLRRELRFKPFMKFTPRKRADPPRLKPGFLPQSSRRKHSPHSEGRGWAGLGWAGAVQGARAGQGLGWCRRLVQAGGLGLAGAYAWCLCLVPVAGADGYGIRFR